MKGEILFEKMTNISDEYVTEAAMGEAYGNPRAERKDGGPGRFLNSGWGVAAVCALVSVMVIVVLVRWGGAGAPIGPAGSTDTEEGADNAQFTFSYHISGENGTPQATATMLPGDSFTVNATVTNNGLPFVYVGSSGGFCPDVRFVHYGEEKNTVIHGGIFLSTDVGTHLVETGEVGYGSYFVEIPADAPAGSYDLILSYKNDEQVYTGVLVVETDDLATLRQDYAKANPPLTADDISIRHNYGTYAAGATVVMIDDGSDVTDALWEEQVGPATIRYKDGNRIQIYHNRVFYTLPEAYENGYLSDSDLADIENLQRRYYEYLYADPEA